MGVRNDTLGSYCSKALEKFRKSRPELAFMAAVQAGMTAAKNSEAGDTDGGTTTCGNGQAMLGQRIVEVAEPHAGADGRHVLRDRHRMHRRDVEDNPVGRRPAGNRMPAAADGHRQA